MRRTPRGEWRMEGAVASQGMQVFGFFVCLLVFLKRKKKEKSGEKRMEKKRKR